MSEIEETTNKSISHKMQDLLDKIKSSVLHTRELYEEFVESARLEGFSDYEINLILKENLKGIVPERTLSYYRKEYLQLEDKSKKKKEDIEDSSGRSRQVAGIDDKKVIEKSSSYTPNPELERFRQEKGKVVEPSDEDDVIKIPDEQREQDQVIYQDTETVRIDLEELTREYNELETKYDQIIVPYEVHSTIVVKGQDIPLTIKVDPYKRTAMPELDQKEAKKLKWF